LTTKDAYNSVLHRIGLRVMAHIVMAD